MPPPSRVWPAALATFVVVAGLVAIFVGPGPPQEPGPLPIALVSTTAPTSTTTITYLDTTVEPASVLPGWTALDPGPLAPRTGAATVWTGEELIVWGGATQGGAYGDGAAYHPDRAAWRRISEAPIAGSADVVAVWTGAEMIVFTTTGSAAYDPVTNTWRAPARRPEDARHPVGAVWTGSEVVLVTHDQTQARLRDELVTVTYDPNDDRWRRAPDAPLPLSYASVLWTRHEVVAVGGFLDGGNRARSADGLASAIAFNPVAQMWREVPGIGLPPYAVVAAWNGRQVIAWDYELDARTSWLAATTWQPAPGVPLDFAECYPEAAATANAVVGWHCGQAAVYQLELPAATGHWTPIATPPDFDPEIFVPDSPVGIGADRVAFWGGDWDGTGGPFFFILDVPVAVAAAS